MTETLTSKQLGQGAPRGVSQLRHSLAPYALWGSRMMNQNFSCEKSMIGEFFADDWANKYSVIDTRTIVREIL